MALTSTVPAAKAALLTLLANTLIDATVTWGAPAGAAQRDWVNIGNVRQTSEARSLNPTRLPRLETYDVDIDVIITRGASGQREATERAYQLAGGVEQALRSNPTLDDVVIVAQPTQMELEEVAEGDVRQSRLTVVATCQARVQGA